jgi:DNA-binding XRE family transcriptional regulator
MTPDDFKAWRKLMDFSQSEAAEAIGVSRGSVENYERGSRREDGRAVEIPLTVALACAAVFRKLEPWDANFARRANKAMDAMDVIDPGWREEKA